MTVGWSTRRQRPSHQGHSKWVEVGLSEGVDEQAMMPATFDVASKVPWRFSSSNCVWNLINIDSQYDTLTGAYLFFRI